MDAQKAPHQSTETRDVVMIERQSLREMLDAVVNTLRSSINLELLQKNEAITSEQHQELSQSLINARGTLITGIKKMRETIEILPSVYPDQDLEPISGED